MKPGLASGLKMKVIQNYSVYKQALSTYEVMGPDIIIYN